MSPVVPGVSGGWRLSGSASGAAGSPWPVPSPLGFTAPNTTLPVESDRNTGELGVDVDAFTREELLEE